MLPHQGLKRPLALSWGVKKPNSMPEHALDKADLGHEYTGISAGKCNWIFHLEGMTVWPRSQFKEQIRSGCLSESPLRNPIRTGWLYNVNHSWQFSGPETTNKPRREKLVCRIQSRSSSAEEFSPHDPAEMCAAIPVCLERKLPPDPLLFSVHRALLIGVIFQPLH